MVIHRSIVVKFLLFLQNTFLKGGYYKYVLGDKVVVLALNTNLYYRFNRAIPNFTNPDDPADQFQFMIDTLKDARAKQLSVHVIAHIAPGGNELVFYNHILKNS
ncbi:unnamed protein product [Anisakis simplex]|uniref:Uncharacterized protein n=1 Tax=Anisakis simplex TaxID=6269 RepID=A0A0M3JGL7_ANISI|nr:unnamed protein product [Anisakis simplex]